MTSIWYLSSGSSLKFYRNNKEYPLHIIPLNTSCNTSFNFTNIWLITNKIPHLFKTFYHDFVNLIVWNSDAHLMQTFAHLQKWGSNTFLSFLFFQNWIIRAIFISEFYLQNVQNLRRSRYQMLLYVGPLLRCNWN